MKKVYVKEQVCIGCRLCEVYCQLQHSKSKDIIKAFKQESPRALSRVRVDGEGVVTFSVRCQQCEDAPCAQVCLTGAITRDPVTGMVDVDEEKCVGCWTCLLACPFGAIKQDVIQKKTVRCDLCRGAEIPVCVTNCPNEALIYADTDV